MKKQLLRSFSILFVAIMLVSMASCLKREEISQESIDEAEVESTENKETDPPKLNNSVYKLSEIPENRYR